MLFKFVDSSNPDTGGGGALAHNGAFRQPISLPERLGIHPSLAFGLNLREEDPPIGGGDADPDRQRFHPGSDL